MPCLLLPNKKIYSFKFNPWNLNFGMTLIIRLLASFIELAFAINTILYIGGTGYIKCTLLILSFFHLGSVRSKVFIDNRIIIQPISHDRSFRLICLKADWGNRLIHLFLMAFIHINWNIIVIVNNNCWVLALLNLLRDLWTLTLVSRVFSDSSCFFSIFEFGTINIFSMW